MTDADRATPFLLLAQTSARLAETRSRTQKKEILVASLATVPRREIGAVVGWLSADPPCGALGMGPARLWALSGRPAAAEASLSLKEVDDALAGVHAADRQTAVATLESLYDRMTEGERTLLVGALTRTLRQGSLAGVMLPAIAELAGRPESDVRRAVLVSGTIARAAAVLFDAGAPSRSLTSIELFRPVAPMLAGSVASLEEALSAITSPILEWKIDGVRAQVHKSGDRVTIFSRHGNDISASCTPLLPALAAIRADTAVMDGELVVVGDDGVAKSFQDSFSALASRKLFDADARLQIHLFDCIHQDGRDLFDEPLDKRLEALHSAVPAELCMPRARVESLEQALAFYDQALARGHEGVMVKDASATYQFGARGRAWLKMKKYETVDLVVLAVEHGSGRRRGWLSNLHLGARAADGAFCMVGKTFKGLTDAMLTWQTAHLEAIAVERKGHVVFVRPELVVEIRFNDVQRSPRYPGGIALRFARVVRHRADKDPGDAEPLDALVARAPPAAPGRGPPKRARRGSKGSNENQLALFDDVKAPPTRVP